MQATAKKTKIHVLTAMYEINPIRKPQSALFGITSGGEFTEGSAIHDWMLYQFRNKITSTSKYVVELEELDDDN